jgi:uncharacterized RDD family membrane protein YckC
MRLDTLTDVETPEGITLRLRAAGVVARFYAFSIDLLIRGAIMLAGSWVLSLMKGVGSAAYLILLFAIEWFYPVVFELTARAATPGKRALGLRVVMDDGLPVTPAAALTRNLLRAADFMPFGYALGLIAMLVRSDFKRLGDVAAGTLVVHDAEVRLHAEPAAAAPLMPARALGLREQAAIVAWALRTPRLTPARAEELAELAEPVVPPGRGSVGERLLGVAHWAMGQR